FRAFDANTGKELWTAELDASGNAIPITYEGRNGKQYVVIAAGGGGHIGGNRPVSDSLIAFSLPDRAESEPLGRGLQFRTFVHPQILADPDVGAGFTPARRTIVRCSRADLR